MIYYPLRFTLYGLLMLLICIQLFWISFMGVHEIYKRKHIAIAIALLMISALLSMHLKQEQIHAIHRESSPSFSVFFTVIIIFLYIITLKNLEKDLKMKSHKISKDSIRESLNEMSAGLCFYEESGLPILMNDNMEYFSQSLFKSSLLNGNEFWERLNQDDIKYGKRIHAVYPTYQLNNGKVVSFSRQIIFMGNERLYQLLASDVTKLFEISHQIEIDNKELAKVNLRLQDYSQNVSTLTRDEEILNAKIRVHDDLGHSIIATKYFLSDSKSTIDKEQLLKMWKTNISLLKKEEVKKNQDDALSYLYDAAKAIGLSLVVEGSVAGWDISSKRLLSIAVRECMTNAIRHAKATTLYVKLENKINTYYISFENDGVNPVDIIEGGGLSSLRKQVEKVNGTMKITCDLKYYLEIEIPRKEGINV